MLHVQHVLAKAVPGFMGWVPVRRYLVDVVRLNTSESEGVWLMIISVTAIVSMIHHGKYGKYGTSKGCQSCNAQGCWR